MKPGDPAAPRTAVLAARTLCVAFGAVNAWSSRFVVNPGGVSHLDMADAILRGDLADAVNAYFSPLYSIAIAPAAWLGRSSPHLEAPAVHAVNFLIFLVALFAFERFLRAVMDRARLEGFTLPGWAWVGFGYAAFAWTALFNNSVVQLTGDLLVAACAYGAGAIVLGMQGARPTVRSGIALGALLALGFLAKTAMLPLALLFLLAAIGTRAQWRTHAPAVAAAALVLACLSAPFIVALSVQKGRPTAGDIGKLVYAWFVLDVPRYAHWQGDNPPVYGVPAHPDRKVHASPDVFEYATPVIGTLPIFYDPSYWYEGLEVPIRPAAIARALGEATRVYWRMAVDSSAELLAVGVLLLWSGWGEGVRRVARAWRPLLPAVAAIPMFALVHTEPRFVGGFVTMALLIGLSSAKMPEEGFARRLGIALIVGASLVMALRTLAGTAAWVAHGATTTHRAHEIASLANASGVGPGSKVAVVGPPFDAYWARLAGVRIVADVADYDVAKFWHTTPEVHATVLEKLRSLGVGHVVAFAVPPGTAFAEWRPLGKTGAYLLDLQRR